MWSGGFTHHPGQSRPGFVFAPKEENGKVWMDSEINGCVALNRQPVDERATSSNLLQNEPRTSRRINDEMDDRIEFYIPDCI